MTFMDYGNKAESYFTRARTDIEPLLPEHVGNVLEIGCGAGATLQWLKSSRECGYLAGIEMSAPFAEKARRHTDEIMVGDAEQLIDVAFEGRRFDVILCLDVIEHMVDPWRFVSALPRLLAPGGVVIFSIPNVRNLAVTLPLILRGQWQYQDEGLLDRTHLRFFTRNSALELASTPPLKVQKLIRSLPTAPSALRSLHRLSFGLVDDLFAIQFLIASRLMAVAAPKSGPSAAGDG